MLRPRFRNLRPRHKRELRHWAIELAVVVIGVLLALWAAEWAQDRSARASSQIAQAAMDEDLMYMALGTMRRFSTQPCVLASLRNLEEAVSVADDEPFVAPPVAMNTSGSDHAFERYYPVGLWNYPTQAFDRAVAVGAFDHMPQERAIQYADAYDWVRNLASANADEELLMTRLAVVEMTDRLDTPTRAMLRETIARLDGQNQNVLNSGRFLFDLMNQLGIEPTEADREEWHRYNEAARAVRGDCVVELPLDFTGAKIGQRWSAEIEQ